MSKMTVYIVIPDNDRQGGINRITVRTTAVGAARDLVGPERNCAMIPADLSIDAARVIARWANDYDDAERERHGTQ